MRKNIECSRVSANRKNLELQFQQPSSPTYRSWPEWRRNRCQPSFCNGRADPVKPSVQPSIFGTLPAKPLHRLSSARDTSTAAFGGPLHRQEHQLQKLRGLCFDLRHLFRRRRMSFISQEPLLRKLRWGYMLAGTFVPKASDDVKDVMDSSSEGAIQSVPALNGCPLNGCQPTKWVSAR